jgi:TatD DNase family protein
MYVDSHCHLSDLRELDSWREKVQRAQTVQVTQFLLAGLDPDDWQRQLEIASEAHKSNQAEIWPVFGLHPYFVNKNSAQTCEHGLDRLAPMLSKAKALGETGLDFRKSILENSFFKNEYQAKAHQIDFFEKQLELASFTSKPIVLHVVRAFDEAVRCVQTWGDSEKLTGLVHAFNGSAPQAQKWLELGFHISVGAAILKPDNKRLHQAVQSIPIERLCLETDSPDQPPPGRSENEPAFLIEIASKVAELKKLETAEILDICSRNTRQLIGYEFESTKL